MHAPAIGLLAIEITRQRQREALEAFRAIDATRAPDPHRPVRTPALRRGLARIAATISRASGAAAVRLDRHVEVDFATPSHRA